MPRLEITPKISGKMVIPGRPEEIDLDKVHGDKDSRIRSELTGAETYLDQLPRANEVKDLIRRGGRVFITERDDYLFVDPPGKNLPEN